MGGHAHGEMASRIAVEEIPRRIRAADGLEGNALLGTAVEETNAVIHAAGTPTIGRKSMGTTVVALLLDPTTRQARWAHVGDSRLYRCREGVLELLTADHTRFGYPYRDKRRPPVDLPHTNQLMGALGILASVGVSLGESPLLPGDTFLLCSDGISGMLPPEAIRTFLRDEENPSRTADHLIASALQAGGRDNATVIVIDID